jgi:hypothetical protein
MNINKKLSQDGEHETAAALDLFKSKNTGDLMYKTEYGKNVSLADQEFVQNSVQTAINNLKDGLVLDFKVDSVGPKVSFTKVSDTDPYEFRDIIIPGELEISRGNTGGGIFNTVLDEGYWNGAPSNTSWNTKFVNADNTTWAPLWDIENRTFDTWRNAIQTPSGDKIPPLYVGTYAVMQHTPTSRYWLILFTEWGVGNNEEYGFSYDRWEIFSAVGFRYHGVNTIDTYEPTAVDQISEGVAFARSSNGPIYNNVEENWNNWNEQISPINTLWNSSFTDSRAGYSGFNNLSNLESRIYTSFVNALDGAVGNNILDTPLIMHDLTTDLYWKFSFYDWAQGGQNAGLILDYAVEDLGAGYTDGTGIILTATGGTGENCTVTVDISGGSIISIYDFVGGYNYTEEDVLTFFPEEIIATPFTISVNTVKRRGVFEYTRQVIPQSDAIKFADGTILNSGLNTAAAECNTFTTGVYNAFPWAVTPTVIESCTKLINTGGMTNITSFTGHKVAGTYYLLNDNFISAYIGTIELFSFDGEFDPGSFLSWTTSGSVVAQADDILPDSSVTSPFANGALVWDIDNAVTIPVDLLNIVVYEVPPVEIGPNIPLQIDLYLKIAAGAAGGAGISGIISFEGEFLIPTEYTVNFVQYV